jgi:hypothetical protein
LFAFFIVDIHSRRIVHLAVTRQPSARWTAQHYDKVLLDLQP